MNQYEQLLDPFSYEAAEKGSAYHSLTERHIQAIWFEQKYFKGLITNEGLPINVISAGIWNLESGPDFLKAHLRIGDNEYRGDIELHLYEDSWVHHGHHQDKRYNNVILHVCMWKPRTPKPICKENGEVTFSVCLEPYLTIPNKRLLSLIDIDLYPYKRFVGSGRCAQTLFNTLPEKEIHSLFTSAAYWRLQQKKKYLVVRFQSESIQLAGGIAMALGYKNNPEAFIDLFSYLLDYRDLPFEELLSQALGICGFFNQHKKKPWEKSSYYMHLKNLWEPQQNVVLHQTTLKLDHVRPFNHPIRRLVYLVKLLCDIEMEKIWKQLLIQWENRTAKIPMLRQTLIEAIPNYVDEYWNHHYFFEVDRKDEQLSLMGDDLKETIIVNTFLPMLAARIREKGDYTEWAAFEALYSSFRAPMTSKSEYLSHRFFGDTPKGQLLRQSQVEQGAFQLHKDFCVHFEASCEGCPFVERYKKSCSN